MPVIQARWGETRANQALSPYRALPVPLELTPTNTQSVPCFIQAEPPLSPSPSRPTMRVAGRRDPP